MNYDKVNGKVGFVDSTHVYENLDTKRKYTSVTTLIGKYAQPFDSEFWSAYKALEKVMGKDFTNIKKELLNQKKFEESSLKSLNISKEDFINARAQILQEWKDTNKASTDRGTAIHAKMENSMYELATNVSLKKYGIGGKFDVSTKYESFLNTESGIFPEYLIYNDELGLAGQIDLLVKSRNDIQVLDYKSNRSIDLHSYYNPKTRSHQMMQYPLNTVEDCNYFHYALQLSTYAYMLQKWNPDFNVTMLKLVHFPHEGGEVYYDVPYLKDEVERMIKHYNKQNSSNNRLKRIQF